MQNKYFSDSFRNMIAIIGILLMFIAGIMLLPLMIIPFYIEELNQAIYILIPACLAFMSGLLLKKLGPPKRGRLHLRQDTIIVLSVWGLATFFSSLTFWFSGQSPSFTYAYFESMSFWTTSGFSLLDVRNTPHIYLFFRSILNFFGSIGIILVVVSTLSETYGMRIYHSEGHSDKLLPNLALNARLIISLYFCYHVFGVVMYTLAGMPLFEAINHSMSALSTGGFSVVPGGIGSYNSITIELITIILMILGGTNFFAMLLLFRGKFRDFFRLGDVRFSTLLIGLAVPLTSYLSLSALYGTFTNGLRVSIFEIISAMTTTGFSIVDYSKWSSFERLVIIIFMLIGGSAGSTAGGIKLSRIYLLIHNFIWKLKKQFMPERSVNELMLYYPQGKVYVTADHFEDSANYFFIYLMGVLLTTGIFTSFGYSLEDSFFEVASAFGGVGLSLGTISPEIPTPLIWTTILAMILGRLEIFVVFIGIIKIFKDLSGVVFRIKK